MTPSRWFRGFGGQKVIDKYNKYPTSPTTSNDGDGPTGEAVPRREPSATLPLPGVT